MSIVGAFPGIIDPNRRTTRAPVNPMDVSTVVSILPKRIHEKKITIVPNLFHLEPGSYATPSMLVVGPVSWWKEIDEQQPILEIPQSSVVVADAIVKDYCNGLLGCNMGSSMPGLFWVPGEISYDDLMRKYRNLLESARVKQDNWYNVLIRMADSLWARTQGNPLSIPDDARLAAQELQIKDKPWMQDFTTISMTNCRACGYLINPGYPVCANCKAIVDEKQAIDLGIKFAQ